MAGMFSDRGWLLKAAAALGLLALVLTQSRRLIAKAYPRIEQMAFFTESDRDRKVFLWGYKVRAVEAAGFQIDSAVGPMHVLSTQAVAVGDYVTIVARPAGYRTVEALRLQVNVGFAWKRPLNYAISVLVLIGYLWLVRRRFRWRIQDGVLRGKY
jgi:hypothetical protein